MSLQMLRKGKSRDHQEIPPTVELAVIIVITRYRFCGEVAAVAELGENQPRLALLHKHK